MDQIKDSSERIKNIVMEFIFKDAYWGYLFSKINRKEDETLPSIMGVMPELDGTITLLYNPIFIPLADDEFIRLIIEHEGLHILNNHIPRLLRIIHDEVNQQIKNQKQYKWNIASDCAVNTLIRNIKKVYHLGSIEFPLCFPDQYNLPPKKTAEYYYSNIPDEKNGGGSGSGENSGEGSESENGSGSEESGSGKASGNIDDHGCWTKNSSKVSDSASMASRMEQYVESIVEESYNNVRNKGNLPANISELINEMLRPPQIPYYQLISKLVKGSRLSKYRRAYTRINKKRVYTFFIDPKHLPIISPFPGKTKDFSFNISVLLDTSGSMSRDNIMEGLSGIKHIIENDKDCKTTVIENDAIIQKEYEIKKVKDIQFDIHGRGGTNLSPGLFRCKELNTDITLAFTDGFTENINEVNRKLLPKRIIWVLTKDGSVDQIDRTGYIVRLPK